MAKAKASALKAQQDAAKKAQEEAAKKAEAAKRPLKKQLRRKPRSRRCNPDRLQPAGRKCSHRPSGSLLYNVSGKRCIKANATALGNYKLTFYDPCVECNGNNLALTATGTTLTEGRTIAVDPSVIPLGSRVFIEGYGVFIAEDTGGAIKGNKIDIAVSTHERANELGVQYANVYLLK